MKKAKVEKQKREFSKTLLIQESVLIWIMSICFLALAFYCVSMGFMGSLPWLAAMVGCPWTAYAISQAYYYKKALHENTTGGVKFESVMADINKVASQYQDASGLECDYDFIAAEAYAATNNVDEYQI